MGAAECRRRRGGVSAGGRARLENISMHCRMRQRADRARAVRGAVPHIPTSGAEALKANARRKTRKCDASACAGSVISRVGGEESVFGSRSGGMRRSRCRREEDERTGAEVGRALAGTPAFAAGPPSETPNRDDSTPEARERPSTPASSNAAKLLREQKAQNRGPAGTRPHQDRGERRGLVGNGEAPLAVSSLNLRKLRRR